PVPVRLPDLRRDPRPAAWPVGLARAASAGTGGDPAGGAGGPRAAGGAGLAAAAALPDQRAAHRWRTDRRGSGARPGGADAAGRPDARGALRTRGGGDPAGRRVAPARTLHRDRTGAIRRSPAARDRPRAG